MVSEQRDPRAKTRWDVRGNLPISVTNINFVLLKIRSLTITLREKLKLNCLQKQYPLSVDSMQSATVFTSPLPSLDLRESQDEVVGQLEAGNFSRSPVATVMTFHDLQSLSVVRSHAVSFCCFTSEKFTHIRSDLLDNSGHVENSSRLASL